MPQRMSEEVRKRIDPNDTARKINEKVKKGPNWYGTKISEGGRTYGGTSEKIWVTPRGEQFQYERDLLYNDPKTGRSTGKLINPVTKEKLTNRTRKRDQARVGQFQTKGKKSLLTKQPTRRKGGGGRSSGGGGGKFSIINRSLRVRSPWHHLKRLLE